MNRLFIRWFHTLLDGEIKFLQMVRNTKRESPSQAFHIIKHKYNVSYRIAKGLVS